MPSYDTTSPRRGLSGYAASSRTSNDAEGEFEPEPL
jgi:hypothetical protein